jgi:hypothetical protein
MSASYICPDTATCRMHHVCRELITLEVNNQCVIWKKDFAVTMIRHYHNHEIPFRICRNCAHPDWDKMKRLGNGF